MLKLTAAVLAVVLAGIASAAGWRSRPTMSSPWLTPPPSMGFHGQQVRGGI